MDFQGNWQLLVALGLAALFVGCVAAFVALAVRTRRRMLAELAALHEAKREIETQPFFADEVVARSEASAEDPGNPLPRATRHGRGEHDRYRTVVERDEQNPRTPRVWVIDRGETLPGASLDPTTQRATLEQTRQTNQTGAR